MPKESTFPVIWDSGASICITNDKRDFVNFDPTYRTNMSSVSKSHTVSGKGEVLWSFISEEGMLQTLKLPAFFIPESKIRLLSTSGLLSAYPEEDIQITIHTDTLNESACCEDSIAAFKGRSIHTYHSEGR